jgi:hypothetical protein
MVDRSREGFGAPVAGCPVCTTLSRAYNYGLGVIFNGAWLLQSPQFGGYGGVAAYLPARRIALAVATTYGEGSFDASGGYANVSQILYGRIGAALAPDDPPPPPAGQ